MQIGISKTDGLITKIVLGTNNILDGACSVSYRKQTNATHQIVLSATRPVLDDEFASIEFVTECDKKIIVHRYTIDTIALRWEVNIKCDTKSDHEGYVAFSLPIVKNLEKIFPYTHCGPFESKEIDEITLTYRQDLYIPMITGYSQNYGLSIVAPFELPKPKLQFVINKQNYIVSFHHLRPGSNKDVNAAIYIVPHGGDWRPCLDFVLKRYPEYFYPANPQKLQWGWYYLSYPDVNETQIKSFHDRHVEWIEFTAFYPFYGLYIPSVRDWGIIFDRDDISIARWEKGAGAKRISLEKMKKFIQLWHKYGIQVFLYYQSAEAWHQYAKKYYNKDIAINKHGSPLPSWLYTHLMNSDPDGDWGRYIIDQARKILKTFPEIDGIFYDRVDYKDFDFGHNDGLTMINGRSAYMLAFGQERMNDILSKLFHKKGKAIWGNLPTSIEVCKGLDGIMAEKNLRYLLKSQYLGLVKPVIYLPYDRLPFETEAKLKNALVCGATISVTYGDINIQNIESKYWPLFDILKNRTWVLKASCLKVPEGLQSNIYRTSDNNYIVVIVSPEKFQVKNHPFEYSLPITVKVPDGGQIEYVYVLSGDWQGVNEIKMEKKGNELHIVLPYHLATSALYLTRKEEYELVRVSSPILIKGNSHEIIFKVNGNTPHHDIVLRTPWAKIHKKITADIIKFKVNVPRNVAAEIDITVSLDGQEFRFSSWVVEPISFVPKEDIFIHHQEGEEIPFYISNNLSSTVTLNLKGIFIKGEGKINIPYVLTLDPFEIQFIKIPIVAKFSGNAVIFTRVHNEEIKWPFKVNTCLAFANGGLFLDDFTDGMRKWKIFSGTWKASINTAQASGPTHFACIYNDNWRNYIFEVTVRCRGSTNPRVDWLKSYIFFRVRDDKNYYRFGFQGDSGVLSLYKRVEGKWIKLRTAPFIPEKNKWYTLRVKVEGTRITCFVDNKDIMAFEDPTFLSGGIGIGVLEDTQQCDYKNVFVKGLGN